MCFTSSSSSSSSSMATKSKSNGLNPNAPPFSLPPKVVHHHNQPPPPLLSAPLVSYGYSYYPYSNTLSFYPQVISLYNSMSKPSHVPVCRNGNGEESSMEVERKSSCFSNNLKAFVSKGPRLANQRPTSVEKRLVPKKTFSNKDYEEKDEVKTSLMIRNIPNHYRRGYLLHIMDLHCRQENNKAESRSDSIRSEFDFFYLPMDFKCNANLGYAFVNFTNLVGALRFREAFHNFKWDVDGVKICEVSLARLQGRDALVNHFANVRFACLRNDYLPVVFTRPRNGWIRSKPIIVGVRVKPRADNGKRKMHKYRRSKNKESSI